jgi:hypothetical protein
VAAFDSTAGERDRLRLPAALSKMSTVAENVAMLAGAKVTTKVQL